MGARKIVVLVGSLRQDSWSRKIANILVSLAPGSLEFQFVNLGNLPLYNQDLEDTPPKEWVEFKSRLRFADGVLFVTPEYNRSIPGVLKNAIDVGSRPYGESAWDGKPGAVVSVSPGSIGGFGANHHLRQSLVFLNVPCMQQPEAYLGNVGELLDAQGEVKEEASREFLGEFMNSFAEWVEIVTKRGRSSNARAA